MKTPVYCNPISNGKNRNKPCFCGSGKKIKKCHGEKDRISLDELQEIKRLWDKANEELQKELLSHE
jgi:uncharacterized protein YecA (UPF0149 family)